MKHPISEINIQHERFRGAENLGDIDGLCDSLEEYGQLQPIIINSDGELIAGFRRYCAALKLGWEEVDVAVQDDLPESKRREIELEENIRRHDFTWAEKAKAIAEIDRIRRGEGLKPWSVHKTAAMLGRSVGDVSQQIKVAKALEDDPELEQRQTTLVGALREIKRKKDIERRKEAVKRKQSGQPSISVPAKILCGDARDLIKELDDESINAIVTNPPFGVDLKLGKTNRKEVYEDGEDYITDLMQEMISEYYRVLKPNSWCLSFFDIRKITFSRYVEDLVNWAINEAKRFREDRPDEAARVMQLAVNALGMSGWFSIAGFDYVQLIPCIWAKPNKNEGSLGNPDKGMITAHEAFILAAKGDAKLIKRGQNNVFIHNTLNPSERDSYLAMPQTLCSELVSLVALGGETILDPFAGSGSIGLGALDCQCEFIGFEIDEETAENGNLKLREHVFAEVA